ncbi:hypothetical protein HJG60_007742 [Phyllostomus discolor]|uniref:Uncharacterized protein n=1 Tax=Phyllostomus discolor TaxID=89673 RepID=A0A834BHC7_9CHIR|nr:hypothetical protein HJG60_007742 [Phyllostomus discolor]
MSKWSESQRFHQLLCLVLFRRGDQVRLVPSGTGRPETAHALCFSERIPEPGKHPPMASPPGHRLQVRDTETEDSGGSSSSLVSGDCVHMRAGDVSPPCVWGVCSARASAPSPATVCVTCAALLGHA